MSHSHQLKGDALSQDRLELAQRVHYLNDIPAGGEYCHAVVQTASQLVTDDHAPLSRSVMPREVLSGPSCRSRMKSWEPSSLYVSERHSFWNNFFVTLSRS